MPTCSCPRASGERGLGRSWLKSGLRARSSAGEHSLHTRGVAGSIPAAPTRKNAGGRVPCFRSRDALQSVLQSCAPCMRFNSHSRTHEGADSAAKLRSESRHSGRCLLARRRPRSCGGTGSDRGASARSASTSATRPGSRLSRRRMKRATRSSSKFSLLTGQRVGSVYRGSRHPTGVFADVGMTYERSLVARLVANGTIG